MEHKGRKSVSEIDRARRRLRIGLSCLVVVAIIFGCLYYFSDIGKEEQDLLNQDVLVMLGQEDE